MLRLVIGFTLALGLTVVADPLFAQRPVALGIIAGINLATEDFDIQSDTNRATHQGWVITGQTDWPLYGPAVLQDRLSYIEKGVVTTRATLLGGSEKLTTDLRYVELSLAPKIKLGVHDFKPYIYLGPRLGLLVGGDLESVNGSATMRSDVRDNFQSWDFGLDMGIGFAYPVVPRLFVLADIGYSYGLTNILRAPVAGENRAFSRDLKIQAGFILEAFDFEPSATTQEVQRP
jgi:hypothetical protein